MNVSAIVSAYYAEDYLLDRILNLQQQVPLPEIIVVAQKGSKEAEIAQAHDVMWILTPDIPTIYAAWNMAIKASNCDYITNANCDDFTYRGAYARMEQVLNDSSDIALVYGDEYVIREDSSVYLKSRLEGSYHILKNKCFVGPFPMWRKSLHEKYGYFDESYQVAGDYEFWLRIASHGEQFCHLRESLGDYYVSPQSAEHRDQSLAIAENIKVRNLYKDINI